MASYSVAKAKNATLVANTADTVTLTGGQTSAQVVNRSTTAADTLFVRVDGVAATVNGDDNIAVRQGERITVKRPTGGTTPNAFVVSIISSAAAPYSVLGLD